MQLNSPIPSGDQPREENLWVAQISLPSEMISEYRYIICEGSQLLKWESLPNNRKIKPEGKKMIVDDGIFGIPKEVSTSREECYIESGWLISHHEIRIRFNSNSILLYENNQKELPLKITLSTREPLNASHKIEFPLFNESKDYIIRGLDLNKLMSLQFDIYNPVGILIGRANSHSSQLDSLCGSCTLPILNTILVPIGEISFQYLIVKPFSHPNMSKVLKYTFWKSIAVIGHRGGGAEQYSKIGKYRRSHIRENTILSFITAASLGAQYVEFDVQLSKDQIPVIFHDFVIPIHSNNEDNIKIPINNITLEQFKKLYVPNNKRKLSNTSSLSYPNQIIRSKSLENIRTENGNDQPFVKSIESHNQQNNIKDSYATLEECFRNIPPETGFNIELKYPRDLPRIADELGLKVYERNQFVDTILKIVFEFAGERKIMFSCFEPDVCIMLRNKQPRYPVFFLTAGGCGREACDIRY